LQVKELSSYANNLIVLPAPTYEYEQGKEHTILSEIFQAAQNFIQVRMKKRAGHILFLIDAKARGAISSRPEGTSGSAEEQSRRNLLLLSLQGGLLGIMKTINKEYGKRGLVSNALYVDWDELRAEEVAKIAKAHVHTENLVAGQSLLVDKGACL
jgi:hypothetical protein